MDPDGTNPKLPLDVETCIQDTEVYSKEDADMVNPKSDNSTWNSHESDPEEEDGDNNSHALDADFEEAATEYQTNDMTTSAAASGGVTHQESHESEPTLLPWSDSIQNVTWDASVPSVDDEESQDEDPKRQTSSKDLPTALFANQLDGGSYHVASAVEAMNSVPNPADSEAADELGKSRQHLQEEEQLQEHEADDRQPQEHVLVTEKVEERLEEPAQEPGEQEIVVHEQNLPEKTVMKMALFEKAVTPSDVGKLNRLVIPKQQAEKCFPLDLSAAVPAIMMTFVDENSKEWRFRYSYWNSSQSYVLTKGWSRFVKEKLLIPGDIVVFEKGQEGELYISCRRRPEPIPNASGSQNPDSSTDGLLRRISSSGPAGGNNPASYKQPSGRGVHHSLEQGMEVNPGKMFGAPVSADLARNVPVPASLLSQVGSQGFAQIATLLSQSGALAGNPQLVGQLQQLHQQAVLQEQRQKQQQQQQQQQLQIQHQQQLMDQQQQEGAKKLQMKKQADGSVELNPEEILAAVQAGQVPQLPPGVSREQLTGLLTGLLQQEKAKHQQGMVTAAGMQTQQQHIVALEMPDTPEEHMLGSNGRKRGFSESFDQPFIQGSGDMQMCASKRFNSSTLSEDAAATSAASEDLKQSQIGFQPTHLPPGEDPSAVGRQQGIDSLSGLGVRNGQNMNPQDIEAQRVKCFVEGSPFGVSVDLSRFRTTYELRESLLSVTEGTSVVYQDRDGDMILLGDESWDFFLRSVQRMYIRR